MAYELPSGSKNFAEVEVNIYDTSETKVTVNIIETVITRGDQPENEVSFGASRSTMIELKIRNNLWFYKGREMIVEVKEKGTTNILFKQLVKIYDANTEMYEMDLTAYGCLNELTDKFDVGGFVDIIYPNELQGTFGQLLSFIDTKTGVKIMTKSENEGNAIHNSALPIQSNWEHLGNYTYREILEFVAGRFLKNIHEGQYDGARHKSIYLFNALNSGYSYDGALSEDDFDDDGIVFFDLSPFVWKDSYKNNGRVLSPTRLVCTTTTWDTQQTTPTINVEERTISVGASEQESTNTIEFTNPFMNTDAMNQLLTWFSETPLRYLVNLKMSGCFFPLPSSAAKISTISGKIAVVFGNIRTTIKGGMIHELTAPDVDESMTVQASSGGAAWTIQTLTQNFNGLYLDFFSFKDLTVQNLRVVNGKFENLDVENITISGRITILEDVKIDLCGRMDNVEFDNLTINHTLNAHEANIGTLTTDTALIRQDLTVLGNTELQNFTALSGKIDNLEVDNQTINQDLTVLGNTELQHYTAVSGQVGTLSGDFLNFKEGEFQTLSSKEAALEHVVVGREDAIDIATKMIEAGYALIGDGTLDSAIVIDAQIGHGTILNLLTDYVNITSKSGNILMKDNTFQIIDDSEVVRVQIGKTQGNDYTLALWDENGNEMWNASGLTGDGIKSGIIRNDMVADDAGIDGSKINLHSLVESINNGEERIDTSSLVYDGQSLTSKLDTTTKQYNALVESNGVYSALVEMSGHASDTNTNQTITATCHVYKQSLKTNVEVTSEYAQEDFIWTRYSDNPDGDIEWNAQNITGSEIQLNADDVMAGAEFECKVEVVRDKVIATKDNTVLLWGDHALTITA